jgi:hypothetical protein
LAACLFFGEIGVMSAGDSDGLRPSRRPLQKMQGLSTTLTTSIPKESPLWSLSFQGIPNP